MQPRRRPRRLHQLGLQVIIRNDALHQRVAEHVAFGVGTRRDVQVKKGHLALRVGHRLPIDEKGRDRDVPRRRSAFLVPGSALMLVLVLASLMVLVLVLVFGLVNAARSRFGVAHAPRFYGGHHPVVVSTASFANDVFQKASLDAHVVAAMVFF